LSACAGRVLTINLYLSIGCKRSPLTSKADPGLPAAFCPLASPRNDDGPHRRGAATTVSVSSKVL
jgi:hypothetical protein